MKNLKKIAALVIVLAMVLSTVGFAAFTDVAEDASYNEAVTVMSALGLLKGYEDGSFGPDKTITRAEFAAVVVRMLGMEDAAAGAATATSFTDVPATHWAAGYVKIANQKAIIAGYGDGTFGPDDEVTYEQAVKMLVCALGYAPMFADIADAYPTAYMAQANTLGMTVGATGKIGDKATRAIVARLAYNALDDKLMEQTGFGSDVKYEVPGENYTTILNKYLKVAKVEGNATAVGFDLDSANKVKFDLTTYTYQDANQQAQTGVRPVSYFYNQKYIGFDSFDMPGNKYDVAEGVVYDKLFTSIAYIDYSEGTDEAVIKAIVPQKSKSEVLVLAKDQLTESYLESSNGNVLEPANGVDSKLTYYVTSAKESNKTDVIKLAANARVFLNNNTSSTGYTATLHNSFAAASSAIPEVTFIDTDGDDKFDVVSYVKVDSFYVDQNQINEKKMKVCGYDFDPEKEDQTYTLTNKDGKEIAFADIKVGDVLNVIESTDGNNKYYEYIVSSDVVEGTVTEVDGNDIYVGGTAYVGSGFAGGETGKFYVDILGRIKKFEQDASSTTYATLMALYNDNNGASEEVKALIYTAEGKFETYAFAAKVKVNGTFYDSENFTVSAADGQGVKTATFNAGVTLTANKPEIISFAANSAGKINKLVWGSANIVTDSQSRYNYYASAGKNAEYTAIDNTIGNYVIAENTVIATSKYASFAAALNPKEVNFGIGAATMFADEEKYDIIAITNDDTDEIVYMMVLDADIKVANNSPVMYVTQAQFSGQTAEGDTYSSIRGYVDGEIVTIKVNDDTNIYDRNESAYATPIAVGDMIQYNEGDYASAVRVIATATEIQTAVASGNFGELAFNINGNGSIGVRDDKYGYIAYGKLNKVSTSVDFVGGSVKIKNNNVDGAQYVIANGAVTKVYGGYSFADVENVDIDGAVETDDVVLVYCFDNEVLGFVVYDAAGDLDD